MSEPCKSFDSSVIDPSRTALDVECTSTAKDSVPDVAVAGPALRQEAPHSLEPRQTAPPELAGHARVPVPPGDDAPESGYPPELVGVPVAEGSLRSPLHAARHARFTSICTEYLIALEWPLDYPPACDRTVCGVVLQLGDDYAVWLAYAHFRRRVMQSTGKDPRSDDDWAVIAYHLVPGAPPNGTLAGAWKTTRDIAVQVRDIHYRFVLPILNFWFWKDQGASPLPTTMDHLSHAPAPSETCSRSNGLGLAVASPASVSRPQDAPPQDVPDVHVGSQPVPPTRLELAAQVVQSLYHSYLTVLVKRPMPSDAERTVAGKVVDIFLLMAVMKGCYEQLGRPLSLGDIGGLAVAHFIRKLCFW